MPTRAHDGAMRVLWERAVPGVVCAMAILLLAFTACAGSPLHQKFAKVTPSPVATAVPRIEDINQRMADNTAYRQRRQPHAADAVALSQAAADLNDEPSVEQAITDRPALQGAYVESPQSKVLTTANPSAVVVLEHRSACLIGEHGPISSVVYVVGMTLDGGCVALYGH